jgi:hypothetical protein
LQWGLRFLEKYLAVDPHHEDLQYRIGKLKDVLARRARGETVRPPPATPGKPVPGAPSGEWPAHADSASSAPAAAGG